MATTFPAPLLFPSPSPAPTFGLTSDERALGAVVPGLLGSATPFSSGAGADLSAQHQTELAMLEQMYGGAVGPSNDPTTWTPEQAAEQTDRALARIAQANPELAEQLQMQRTGEQPEDGGSFWDGLKQLAGDVLSLPGIKQAVDIISRPAHLIPELIMDWGEESVWKNASDALLGKSDVSWDDVLVEKFGMERNWVTAALGFVGDVATDPLTYLTFGAGGVSREAAASLAGKVTWKTAVLADDAGKVMAERMVSELSVLKNAAGEAVVKNVDDALEYMWRARMSGTSAFRKPGMPTVDAMVDGMQRVHPDAAGGVLHVMLNEGERQVVEQTLRIADDAFNAAATGGWSRLTAETAEKLGIPKSAVDAELKRLIGQGNVLGWGGKAKYMEGRYAGALMGGWRMRASIPFLGIRIQTGRILPFTARADFQAGRRFFTGLSGELRLQRLVAKGVPEAEDALRAFWSEGFKGVHKFSPAIARELGGGSFLHLGSVLYPASEAIGKITAHFTPHAKVMRGGGLGEKVAADVSRLAQGKRESLADYLWTITREDGSQMKPADVQRFLVDAWGLGGKRAGRRTAEETAELFDAIFEYQYTMPELATSPLGAKEFWDGRIAAINQAPPGTLPDAPDLLARAREMQARAIAAEERLSKFGDKAVEATRMFRSVDNATEEELARAGILGARSLHDRMLSAPELTPEQGKELAATGHYGSQRVVWELEDVRGADVHNITMSAAKDQGGAHTAHGIQMRGARDIDGEAPFDAGIDGPPKPTFVELPEEGAAVVDEATVARAANRDISNDTLALLRRSLGLSWTDPADNMFVDQTAEVAVDYLDQVKFSDYLIGDTEVADVEGLLQRFMGEHGVDPARVMGTPNASVGVGAEAAANEAALALRKGDHDAAARALDKYENVASKTLGGTKWQDELGSTAKSMSDSPIEGWTWEEFEREKAMMLDGKWHAKEIPTLRYDPQTGKMILQDGNHRLALAKYLRSKGYSTTHMPVRVEIAYRPGTLEKGLKETAGAGGDVMRAEVEAIKALQIQESLKAMSEAATSPMLTPAQKTAAKNQLDKLAREFMDVTGRHPSTLDGKYLSEEDVYKAVASRTGSVYKGLHEKTGRPQFGTVDYKGAMRRPPGVIPPEQLRGAQVFPDGSVVPPTDLRPEDILPRSAIHGRGRVDEFVWRPQNPVVRDVSKGKSTRFHGPVASEEEDLYQIAYDRAEAAVKMFQSGEKALPDSFEDLDPFVQEVLASEMNDTQKIAEIVTADLMAKGHDGIITYGEGNAIHATAFTDPQLGRPVIAHLNKSAAHVAQTTGTMPLVLTNEVIEAAVGLGKPSPEWLRRLTRQVSGMERARAEETVVKALKERGIRLRPHQSVFETDPLKILNRHVERTARDVVDNQLGKMGRRLDRMGFSRSPFMGEQTGLNRMKWVIPPSIRQALNNIGGDAQKAADRAAAVQTRQLPILEREADNLSQKVARLLEGGDEDMQDILRAVNESGSTQVEESMKEAAKRMEDAGAPVHISLRNAVREGLNKPGGYEDLGNGVWVTRDNFGGMQNDIYFVWDKKGDKALAVRDVQDGSVSAMTAENMQGHGLGERLLRAHWKDQGIEDPAAIIEAIKQNSLTPLGQKLNIRAAQNILEEQYRAAAQEARDRVAKATMQAQDALGEYNRTVARMTTQVAEARPALVPAEDAANMTGFEQLDIPGFSDVALPSFMAQELAYASRGFKQLNDFQKVYRRFTTWWKEWATFMWPGFHVRNFMGAFFNNFLQGVGFGDYVVAGRIRRAAHEMMTTPESEWRWANRAVSQKDARFLRESRLDQYFAGMKDPTYSDLANIMSEQGIVATHGRAFAEARVGTEYLEEKLARRRGFERIPFVGRPYVKAAKGAGTLTENLFRTASYVRGLRESAGDFATARLNVMMRHGDYQDLTDWEYGIVRDLLPFYKWMRTNVPLQVHQLFESPGKLLAVGKAQSAVYTGMGMDYDIEQYKMPEWMRENFTVPLGPEDARQVAMLDLPMADLFTDGREFISAFLPMVRPAIESYIFEKSTFSGAPIEGEMVPLSSAFDVLAPILTATGLAQRGEDGGVYISDKTQNMLGAIPIYSRLRNWMSGDPDRVQLRANTIASAMFGMGLRPQDDQALASTELGFYYTQVLPQLERLRSLGVELPTTNDLEKVYGDVNTVLASLGITPGGITAQAA